MPRGIIKLQLMLNTVQYTEQGKELKIDQSRVLLLNSEFIFL
jgi:hypothetical protein